MEKTDWQVMKFYIEDQFTFQLTNLQGRGSTLIYFNDLEPTAATFECALGKLHSIIIAHKSHGRDKLHLVQRVRQKKNMEGF